MKMYKNKGIIYSNMILEYITEWEADNTRLSVEVFNNCREQGYKVYFINTEDGEKYMTLWIYAHRNSDEPTITWTEGASYSEIFDQESWLKRTESFENPIDAGNRIIELLEKYTKVF